MLMPMALCLGDALALMLMPMALCLGDAHVDASSWLGGRQKSRALVMPWFGGGLVPW